MISVNFMFCQLEQVFIKSNRKFGKVTNLHQDKFRNNTYCVEYVSDNGSVLRDWFDEIDLDSIEKEPVENKGEVSKESGL